MDFETPEWDAAEQAEQYEAGSEESGDTGEPAGGEIRSEADPADLAEQHIVVPDEEDYEHG